MTHRQVPRKAKNPCEPLPHLELLVTKERQLLDTHAQGSHSKKKSGTGWLTFIHGSELIIQFKAVIEKTTVNTDLGHTRHFLLLHLPFHTTRSAMMLTGLITNAPLACNKSRCFSAYSLPLSNLISPSSLLWMITLLPSPQMTHCTGVLHAQLHTHRSLALRSSLVGELGSKWESSGGSSFPCASSQARSSRSFLLLARSAARREDKQRSHSALLANRVLQGKLRQLLWLSRAPLKCFSVKTAKKPRNW